MHIGLRLEPRLALWSLIALGCAVSVAFAPPHAFVPIALVVLVVLLLPASPLGALIILLSLSPLRALIATEANIAFPLSIDQVLLLLYLGVWLVDRAAKRKPILAIAPSPVLLALAGAVAVYSVGAWTSVSVGSWLNEWLKWVLMALLVWQLSLSVEANWRWLVFALLIAAAANAIVGLYIFFGGSGADHLLILGRYFRAFGTFGQPNPFGGFMGLALPLALAGAWGQLDKLSRAWRRRQALHIDVLLVSAMYGAAAALLAAALVASWSRGAWLGFAVSALVLVVCLPRRLARGIASAICLTILFAALWLAGLIPSSVVARLTTAATDLVTFTDVRGINFTPTNYAVVERLAHWQAAIDMARDYPFSGVGLGNYEIVYEQYRLINWEDALGHAHNLYLNLLAEAGAVGLLAYLLFWLFIVRLTWSLRRHPDASARALGIGLLGCWTYIAVHSLFDNLYVNNLFFHIGVLLSVLAILQRQTERTLPLE